MRKLSALGIVFVASNAGSKVSIILSAAEKKITNKYYKKDRLVRTERPATVHYYFLLLIQFSYHLSFSTGSKSVELKIKGEDPINEIIQKVSGSEY